MSLKVAYLVDEWVTSTQTFIRDEIAELHRQGVEVDVIALRSGDVAPRDDEPATVLGPAPGPTTRLVQLAAHPVDAARMARAQLAMRPERLVHRAALPTLARRLRARDTRWVHAHFGWEASGVAEALAGMLGVGWSFTAHANDIYVANRHLRGKLARANHVVTVCDYNAAHLRDLAPAGQTIEVVVCGVEVPPAPPRDGERFDVDVLAVGRLVPKKGFDVLVRAAAQLARAHPGLTIEIVGSGPEEEPLQRLIDELGVQSIVRLAGAQPHGWVLDRMERARVACLPARIAPDGDRDSMPLVIKEAMARRVPVVATEIAAIPEMVDESVGRLVEPEDPSALAAALGGVLADPPLAQQLGDAGRERVLERFTLAGEVAKLRAHFEAWTEEVPQRTKVR